MKVFDLKVNHHQGLLGMNMKHISLSWKLDHDGFVKDIKEKVYIYEEEQLVYESQQEVNRLGFEPEIILKPRTRYIYQVEVNYDGQIAMSDRCAFETGKMNEGWQALFVGSPYDKKTQILCRYPFELKNKVKKARLYVHALGLYEAYMNHEKLVMNI